MHPSIFEGYISHDSLSTSAVSTLMQEDCLLQRYLKFQFEGWGNTNSQLLCTILASLLGKRQENEGISGPTNNDINQNTQTPLHIITLLIPQKAPNNNNCHDQHHNIKHLEVQIHSFIEAPANDYDKGGVEKGGLYGGAKDVRKGEVHLIVPSFVNGGEMLGGFFDERNKDETHEGVGDAAFGDYILDLLDWREMISACGDRSWNAAKVIECVTDS